MGMRPCAWWMCWPSGWRAGYEVDGWIALWENPPLDTASPLERNAHMTTVYDTAQLRPPALEELFETFRYRHLIVQFVRRDIITRYKRSFLGIAWSMLNPLGTMIVMTIVFSSVFSRGDSAAYPVFLLSGLLAWNFFSNSVNLIMNNMVWGSNLLTRIYVPRSAFAVASLGTGFVHLGLEVIPLVVVMLFVRVPIRWTMLFLPVPSILIMFFTLGLGLILSVIAIYFADIREMFSVILRAWLYLTPIIYPEEMLSGSRFAWLLQINPLTHLIELFRIPILEGRIPTMAEMLPGIIIALATLIFGWVFFARQADEFAYRI